MSQNDWTSEPKSQGLIPHFAWICGCITIVGLGMAWTLDRVGRDGTIPLILAGLDSANPKSGQVLNQLPRSNGKITLGQPGIDYNPTASIPTKLNP